MIDRSIRPKLGGIKKLDIENPVGKTLNNNIPVYIIEAGDQDIIRVDIIFPAGSRQQDKTFQASFTNSLLTEGTEKRSAHQIAEDLDFYGSYIYPGLDRDDASLQVYSLGKHLDKTLDTATEILMSPAFLQTELDTLRNKRRQAIGIDMQKSDYRARKVFFSALFGPDHAYGKTGEEQDLDLIEREDLVQFHRSYYHPGNCRIIISGQNAAKHFTTLNKKLGSWQSPHLPSPLKEIDKEAFTQENKIREEVPEAVQASIRLGKIMPCRLHEDYASLSIINTLLGGYFGSRLMQNIREEKGYTYGVGSSLFSFREKGVFLIGTDVGVEHSEDTLKECYREIERLKTELVDPEELERVRLYIQGELTRQLDGPYNRAESFKSLLAFGMDFTYLDIFLATLNKIDPEIIRSVSEKYFSSESFIEVVAGPFSK